MSNNRKYLGYLAVILLLIGVLAGKRHWSEGGDGHEMTESIGKVSEYTLYADRPLGRTTSRDIFYGGNLAYSPRYQRSEGGTDMPRYGQRGGVERHISASAEKSESGVPAPVASGEINGIKLLGVVENGKRLQAFLALGSQREIVDVGQMLQGRYKVVDIKIAHVSIVDLNDNSQRIIPVSGR